MGYMSCSIHKCLDELFPDLLLTKRNTKQHNKIYLDIGLLADSSAEHSNLTKDAIDKKSSERGKTSLNNLKVWFFSLNL